MWIVAGRLRIDPNPFTIRQLQAMDYSHIRAEWMHTARILEMINNAAGGKERYWTFHPHGEELAEQYFSEQEEENDGVNLAIGNEFDILFNAAK